MKWKTVVLTMLSILVYPVFHELSHYFVALLAGVPVIELSYNYIVTEGIFSGFTTILFKSAGLVFVFYPSLCVFLILWGRRSVYSIVPQIWMALSPGSSIMDFYDICSTINLNYYPYFEVFLTISSLLLVASIYMAVVEAGRLDSFEDLTQLYPAAS